MKCFFLFLAFVMYLGIAPSSAYAQRFLQTPTCTTLPAPVPGALKTDGRNQGVATPGFVSLGPAVPVVHGVDVSKWQNDIDPSAVAHCGGLFAYIRVSAGLLGHVEQYYPSIWAQSRAAGLVVGGYHYLTIIPLTLKYVENLARFHFNGAKYTVKDFEASGHMQALLFSIRYEQLRADDSARDASVRFLPPMLAVVDKKKLPGKVEIKPEWYIAALCAFVSDVESKPYMHGKRLIIFTRPGLFEEMGLGSAPCLHEHKHLYWVQLPTEGADGLPAPDGGSDGALVQKLCDVADGSRECLFHQYTNRGGLPMGSLHEGLDLSRFLGTPAQLSALTSGK